MTNKKINLREVVDDLQGGMHKTEIMAKYELSPSRFEKLYAHLIKEKLLVDAPAQTAAQPAVTATCAGRGFSVSAETAECPRCGLILTRFQNQEAGRTMDSHAVAGAPETQDFRHSDNEMNAPLELEKVPRGPDTWSGARQIVTVAIIVVTTFVGMCPSYHAVSAWLIVACFLVFVVGYGVVVLWEAITESVVWGLFVFFTVFVGGLVFMVFNWDRLYRGRFVPK